MSFDLPGYNMNRYQLVTVGWSSRSAVFSLCFSLSLYKIDCYIINCACSQHEIKKPNLTS